jgi:hypothetical protein
MLTIKDLSTNEELDRAAMTDVRGGFLGVFNLPIIDAGFHSLYQGQALAVDQSYNLGGLNLVINEQEQDAVSGQVVS